MRITQLVELVAAILATVLNLILIPIIITKSSVKMGPYKYLLLAYTITAVIYSYCVSTALFVGLLAIQNRKESLDVVLTQKWVLVHLYGRDLPEMV